MHREERIRAIEEILQKNGYVTVSFLVETLDYSTATVNRDLNVMQKRRMVKRSYGGVELVKSKSVPLVFRYHKMHDEKLRVARRAAMLIGEDDVVFIFGATTTQYMAQYIAAKKGVTVITNNMVLATYLSDCGTKVVCLGGRVSEPPAMLTGVETVENARRYRADKMFFSSRGFDDGGNIYVPGEMNTLVLHAMMENTREIYYLADHEKRNPLCAQILCDLSSVRGIVTDHVFPDAVKERFKNTEFIEVE